MMFVVKQYFAVNSIKKISEYTVKLVCYNLISIPLSATMFPDEIVVIFTGSVSTNTILPGISWRTSIVTWFLQMYIKYQWMVVIEQLWLSNKLALFVDKHVSKPWFLSTLSLTSWTLLWWYDLHAKLCDWQLLSIVISYSLDKL